jgi:putative restriction endonuclease
MAERVFGPIPSVQVGQVFRDRNELAASGVHTPLQAGISGSQDEGAVSIVVSGGYEDDEDLGDLIVYTGHGGNDPNTGQQVADQEFTRGNRALASNAASGLPVRVVRGAALDSPFAPADGYRYDGLYVVDDYWHERGRSGFKVYRYRLRRDDPSEAPWQPGVPAAPAFHEPAPRREVTTSRVIRSSAVIRQVKELHDYRCQVCGIRLETPAGPYAEGAHIRPLGAPHDGPDIEENVLCLCPNHHALFDLGAFSLADDLSLIASAEMALPRALRTVSGHQIHCQFLAYHRGHYTEQV